MSEIRVKQHPTLGILVCTDGHIMVPSTYFNKKSHWTKGWKFNTGYLGIRLHGKNYQVHRLVAETFISNKDNKPTVDHINRIKTDNRIENLRWATIQEQNENHSLTIHHLNTLLALYTKAILSTHHLGVAHHKMLLCILPPEHPYQP